MGDVVKAKLIVGRRSYEGTALLETNEVLFRGDRRVVIARRSIRKVSTAGGRLTIEHEGGRTVLDLGPRAERWAQAILNPKSVLDKLGVKSGQRVSLVALEEPGFSRQLAERGIDVHEGKKPRASSDAIFLGVRSRDDLAKIGTQVSCLVQNGALWTVRPKGSKEVTERDVMAAGKAAGLVDVKVVAFSETRTAEKFVIPLAKRVSARPRSSGSRSRRT